MTSAEERLNRDKGPELPGCWMATLRKQETRVRYANLQLLVTSVDELSANPGDT